MVIVRSIFSCTLATAIAVGMVPIHAQTSTPDWPAILGGPFYKYGASHMNSEKELRAEVRLWALEVLVANLLARLPAVAVPERRRSFDTTALPPPFGYVRRQSAIKDLRSVQQAIRRIITIDRERREQGLPSLLREPLQH
jgi:hypothetical protein